MKKLLTFLLIAGLLLSVAACGTDAQGTPGGENDAAGAKEPADQTAVTGGDLGTDTLRLVLRAGVYADVIKECLPAFEKEHNVTCVVQDVSEADLYTTIALDAINVKGSYDLCMVDGSWMAEFTKYHVLANLTELGYSLDSDIIPATTKICYVDNNLYLAPYYGNVTVLMYNKANVEEGGYDPDTVPCLEDMLAVCKKAQASGKKGFIYRGDSKNNLVVDFLPVLLSYGGWVIDENNQPSVNTKEFKEAMNFYLQLIATGEAQTSEKMVASIDSGSGAMGIAWPGWYTPSAETAADFVALAGTVSKGDAGNSANVYGVWTIGIPENSRNKALAKELLEYLMDKDVQKATVKNGGVPCRYSCLQDKEVLAMYPHYGVICSALENGVYRPVIADWTEFYTILGTEMDNIINGKKTVDEGLNDAQEKLTLMMNY